MKFPRDPIYLSEYFLHLIFQCLRLVQDFSAVRSLKLPLPPGAFDFFPVPFRSNLSSVRGWLRVLRRCGSSPPPADCFAPVTRRWLQGFSAGNLCPISSCTSRQASCVSRAAGFAPRRRRRPFRGCTSHCL
jgi:hypothetical protein